MKKMKSLSPVEWQLMNIFWNRGTLSARDIYDETLKDKKRTYQAVKNMLDRLVYKKILSRTKFGPIWLYSPIIPRDSMVSKEIENFVDNVLDHTVAPLFAHFSKIENLSEDDIEELKKIIKAHSEDK